MHEVGEHAALNEMVGDVQYEALSKNFDELLKAEDPLAVAASNRIPKRTPTSKLKSEQLAYLVEFLPFYLKMYLINQPHVIKV